MSAKSFASFVHGGVHHANEPLYRSLHPARILVHFDEPVRKIGIALVLNPVNATLNPIFTVPGLVIADQVVDHFFLRIGSIGQRLLQIANGQAELARI